MRDREREIEVVRERDPFYTVVCLFSAKNIQNMQEREGERERSHLFDFDGRVSLHGASQVAATVGAVMTAIRLLAGYHIVHAAATAEAPVR